MMTEGSRSKTIWILFQSRDRASAWRNYSNRRLLQAASALGYEAELLAPGLLDAPRRADLRAMRCLGRVCEPPHAVLCRSGVRLSLSGRRLLARLERLGARAEPSAGALARARDRFSGARIAARAGLRVPPAADLRDAAACADLAAEAGDCAVLLRFESRGRGVFPCRGVDEARQIARRLGRRRLALQAGRPWEAARRRILVVGGRALAGLEAPAGAFRAGAAGWSRPASLARNGALERDAETLTAAMGLATAAVDFALASDGPLYLGVATAPDLEPFDVLCQLDSARSMIETL